jgi:hypothetical protein
LADECEYVIEFFEESGCRTYEDLEEAKRIIKETKNGKIIPLWSESLEPMYSKRDIQGARDIINEYKRLKSLMQRLNAM